MNEVQDGLKVARDAGAHIEIIGRWPWATFESKPSEGVRDTLKAAGWRWSSRKAAWYIPATPAGRLHAKNLDVLRARFGSMSLEDEVTA